LKEFQPSNHFSKFASNKIHIEFYCFEHCRLRLKQYCFQDSLIDVVTTGTDILIESTVHAGEKCHDKSCLIEVKYKITRKDNF